MSKHTPGPWQLVAMPEVRSTANDNGHDSHFLIHDSCGNDIIEATCSDGWVDSPGEHWPVITESNARLIAAAPDLLEALKVYVMYDDSSDIHTIRSRAAIAKAEGK